MRRIVISWLHLLVFIWVGACSGSPDLSAKESLELKLRITQVVPVTPEVFPTLTPHRYCVAAPESFLILQERGRVKQTEDGKALTLRAGPGTGYEILDLIEPLAGFLVLDGLECNGLYTWFQVDYRGVVGWIAEGDGSGYVAEPHLPG